MKECQTNACTYLFYTLQKFGIHYVMKLIVQGINYSNFAITKTQRSYFFSKYIVFTKECPKPGHSLGKRIRKHEMKERKRNFAFLVFVHI